MTDARTIYRIAPHHRLQWEEAQQCYVILFPEGMVKLNGSAGEVMSLVDGQRSVAEIIAALQAKFPQVPNLEQDIISMLQLASDKAWIHH